VHKNPFLVGTGKKKTHIEHREKEAAESNCARRLAGRARGGVIGKTISLRGSSIKQKKVNLPRNTETERSNSFLHGDRTTSWDIKYKESSPRKKEKKITPPYTAPHHIENGKRRTAKRVSMVTSRGTKKKRL